MGAEDRQFSRFHRPRVGAVTRVNGIRLDRGKAHFPVRGRRSEAWKRAILAGPVYRGDWIYSTESARARNTRIVGCR